MNFPHSTPIGLHIRRFQVQLVFGRVRSSGRRGGGKWGSPCSESMGLACCLLQLLWPCRSLWCRDCRWHYCMNTGGAAASGPQLMMTSRNTSEARAALRLMSCRLTSAALATGPSWLPWSPCHLKERNNKSQIR